MTTAVVLDCDPGTDDAVAIMLAALHPDLDLVAITTVNGNVPVANCTDNALRSLACIGRHEIPVYEGAASPLARLDFPVPRTGAHPGHGERLDLPPAKAAKQPGIAAGFLVEHFGEGTCEDVLVAVGPLSNVALAVKLHPGFASGVRKLVIMGGGHVISNTTAAAESNIWRDPEAAKVVLSAGFAQVVLVTLDATHKALISVQDCDRLRALGTPAALATAAFAAQRARAWPIEGRPGATTLHDPLCLAYLVDPSVLDVDDYWVDVETLGELTVGRTVIDTEHVTGRQPNARVALNADAGRFMRVLIEGFAPA